MAFQRKPVKDKDFERPRKRNQVTVLHSHYVVVVILYRFFFIRRRKKRFSRPAALKVIYFPKYTIIHAQPVHVIVLRPADALNIKPIAAFR
jgi:hypothetical protein